MSASTALISLMQLQSLLVLTAGMMMLLTLVLELLGSLAFTLKMTQFQGESVTLSHGEEFFSTWMEP